MDSGLNHIESMYLSYSGLLEEFSEDVIRSRYAFLYKECMEFLKSQKLESEVRLDEVLLMHAVLDYFSDVSRLKKFHHIHHINESLKKNCERLPSLLFAKSTLTQTLVWL